MAETDHEASLCEPRGLLRRHVLRRDGDHHRIELALAGEHQFDVLLLHRPDQLRIVRTLARHRKMRAFEMQAEETRHAFRLRLAAGLDGPRGDLVGIGDQRRQQRRRAELGVRGADLPEARYRRFFVQQHAAAAVHLQVYEARYDQLRLRRRSSRCFPAVRRSNGSPRSCRPQKSAPYLRARGCRRKCGRRQWPFACS